MKEKKEKKWHLADKNTYSAVFGHQVFGMRDVQVLRLQSYSVVF